MLHSQYSAAAAAATHAHIKMPDACRSSAGHAEQACSHWMHVLLSVAMCAGDTDPPVQHPHCLTLHDVEAACRLIFLQTPDSKSRSHLSHQNKETIYRAALTNTIAANISKVCLSGAASWDESIRLWHRHGHASTAAKTGANVVADSDDTGNAQVECKRHLLHMHRLYIFDTVLAFA